MHRVVAADVTERRQRPPAQVVVEARLDDVGQARHRRPVAHGAERIQRGQRRGGVVALDVAEKELARRGVGMAAHHPAERNDRCGTAIGRGGAHRAHQCWRRRRVGDTRQRIGRFATHPSLAATERRDERFERASIPELPERVRRCRRRLFVA